MKKPPEIIDAEFEVINGPDRPIVDFRPEVEPAVNDGEIWREVGASILNWAIGLATVGVLAAGVYQIKTWLGW